MKIFFRFLLLLLISTSVVAKSPPPGVGSDLPANILLMLDTSGSMNNGVAASPLSTPLDVAVDSQGNIFVSQIGHHLVKKFDSEGNFIKSWGGWGGRDGQFRYALRIATDSDDNVYVTDFYNHRIQKFDNDGKHLRNYPVNYPDSLEVDGSGNIYSSERWTWVRKQDQNGNTLARWNNHTLGSYPFGISAYGGYVYVANAYKQTFTKYTESGAGAPGTNTWSTSGWAWDVKASSNGVYVANYNTNKIQKFSHSGTLIKEWGSPGASNTQFNHPAGLSIDTDGNLYVNDRHNHSIKKFDSDGTFISHIGGRTRLDIAKDALKWIVSNSELNKGANFGLMTWDRTSRIKVDIKPSGAQEIYKTIDNIAANCKSWNCTNIGGAMSLAQSYISPIIKASCQNTILVVISDGSFTNGITQANNIARALHGKQGISTFVISLASGAQTTHKNLAEAGGTYTNDGDDTNDYSPVEANHKQKIIDALIEFVRTAVDNNTSTFTKPVLRQESQTEDYVYQSTFKYVKKHQWQGQLKKYQLVNGVPKDDPEWDAAKILNTRNASNRQVWTIASDFNVTTSLNNFVSGNADKLKYLLWENVPIEPTDSQAQNLINFIRGVDVYNEVTANDEKKNGLISGERWKLGDIYHSELRVIDMPSAKVSNVDVNTEAYYRFNNQYTDFVNGNSCGGPCKDRKQIVYVGANDGLLHAFDSKNGNELWAFLPPMLLSKIRTAISSKNAESHSIYGVDGSPVIKDIFYNNKWRTVLLAGIGRGGRGYFALDVTNPNSPSFLFAFSNDLINNIVSHWDSDGHKTDLGYAGGADSKYAYSKIGDATSTPQIILIPYKGKQKWVAVFGAGFNAGVNSGYGSAIYIVDLENNGEVLKRVDIPDIDGNDIANSIPAPVVAITPDSTSIANYKGAIIYFSDLEGSLWKLNLTNQGTLFDITKIFKADSTFDNDRLEFFQVTASIGNNDNLWLYYGTGNQQKLQRMSPAIKNRIYGIKDIDFPKFKAINKPSTIAQLNDTTDSGAICPTDADSGWYVRLDKNEKITGQLAIDNETIFASRYIPNDQNLCKPGSSTLSEHDFMCGNVLRKTKLGEGIATGAVIYKGKVYIGITGNESGKIKDGDKEIGERKKSLIVLTPKKGKDLKTKGDVSYESWREVF